MTQSDGPQSGKRRAAVAPVVVMVAVLAGVGAFLAFRSDDGSGVVRERRQAVIEARGATITYRTANTELVDALHVWFDAQLTDHGRHAHA